MTKRLLRKPAVLDRVGYKNWVSIWKLIQRGEFPQGVVLNPNCKNPPVAWLESEVEAWIASRPAGAGRRLSPEAYSGRKKYLQRDRTPAEAPIRRAVLLRPELRGSPGRDPEGGAGT
jgi:predicted DNA-binding transcriptional regulator AlpA